MASLINIQMSLRGHEGTTEQICHQIAGLLPHPLLTFIKIFHCLFYQRNIRYISQIKVKKKIPQTKTQRKRHSLHCAVKLSGGWGWGGNSPTHLQQRGLICATCTGHKCLPELRLQCSPSLLQMDEAGRNTSTLGPSGPRAGLPPDCE